MNNPAAEHACRLYGKENYRLVKTDKGHTFGIVKVMSSYWFEEWCMYYMDTNHERADIHLVLAVHLPNDTFKLVKNTRWNRFRYSNKVFIMMDNLEDGLPRFYTGKHKLTI